MKLSNNLFDEYKKKTGDQILFNGIHNFTILNNSLGWTQAKYFKKWFDDNTPLYSFSLAQETRSKYWVTETHFEAISKEVFKKYWVNVNFIKDLENNRQQHIKVIEQYYKKLTPDFIQNSSKIELEKMLIDMNNHEGYANCNGWYVFAFEKDFVLNLLEEVGSNISKDRLNKIWDTLVLPNTLSFDKRSALKVFDMLDRGASIDSLITELEYLYSGFFGLPNTETIKKKINEEYIEYSDKSLRNKIRNEITEDLKDTQNKYEKWLQTLSDEEQKLAKYTKHIIMLRDNMRDSLSMTITVVYRTLYYYSQEYGIPIDILNFALFEEVLRGGRIFKIYRNRSRKEKKARLRNICWFRRRRNIRRI